jgi:hypothetical protein
MPHGQLKNPRPVPLGQLVHRRLVPGLQAGNELTVLSPVHRNLDMEENTDRSGLIPGNGQALSHSICEVYDLASERC